MARASKGKVALLPEPPLGRPSFARNHNCPSRSSKAMPLVTQACPASSHSGGHVGVSGHAPICTCCAIETELMNTIVVKPMRKGNGVQTGYPEPVRREPRSSSRGTLPVPRPLPQGLLWTVGCTRPLPGFGTTCSMALGSLLTAEPPLHSQIHLLTLRTFH